MMVFAARMEWSDGWWTGRLELRGCLSEVVLVVMEPRMAE